MDRLLRLPALFLLAALAACGTIPTPTVRHADFGTAQTLGINESVAYSDGLVVTLVRIDDSRCKPNVQCIWAGELAPTFSLAGGELGSPRNVTLGTARTPTATVGAYALTLGAVTVGTGTPDTATVTVTRGSTPVAGGNTGVRGTAHVGPTCPVERTPPDPACADRPYAGRFVIESVGGMHIADVTSDANGRFALALPAGSYRLRLADRNTMPSLAEQAFTVGDGWTTLDLALDSGIR
jgi:hypothetical protein